MKSVRFECESITPMFMYGENQNEPELRAASIKGVMRFWWRAINGNLPLDDYKENGDLKKGLKSQEADIFGSTDEKSSFSIKIKHYKFQGKDIPKNTKFDIEFLLSNRCNFDIQSFFELVVVLGLFGQKGTGEQKTQGSIKIVKVNDTDYAQTIDLNYIYTLIAKFSSNYSKKKLKIENKAVKEEYPLVKDISTSKSNQLYVNFIHSQKLKTIKKDLKAYNG